MAESTPGSVAPCRPRWGVLSEDGTVYGVGCWKNGRKRHDGALWLAMRECRRLRRTGEPRAKVVRRVSAAAPKKLRWYDEPIDGWRYGLFGITCGVVVTAIILGICWAVLHA